jgi:hypothetical protein
LWELRGAHSVSPFIVEEFVVLRFEVYHSGGDWYMVGRLAAEGRRRNADKSEQEESAAD